MNSFDKARRIEAEAIAQLLPYLKRVCEHGEFTLTDGSLWLQKFMGDFIAKYQGRRSFIELKAERKHTGNLFLETWSNRSRDTPGWLWTCQSDWLWYYFLGEGDDGDFQPIPRLYVMQMRELRDWARGTGKNTGGISGCRERLTRCDQENDTWGVPVSVSALSNNLKSFEGPLDPTVDEQRTRKHMQRSIFA